MSVTAAAPFRTGRHQLLALRLVPAIETYPALVRFVETTIGKVALWGVFALGLRYFLTPKPWLPVASGLLLITLFPRWRWFLVGASTVVATTLQNNSPAVLLVFAVAAALFWCARRWPESGFAERPVAYLLVGCTLLVLMASSFPVTYPPSRSLVIAWGVAGFAVTYMWFVGYVLMDRSATFRHDTPLELGTLLPFWGSTTVPYPKGAAYLRRIEAHTDEQLAITQLKGLKLLVWAILLALLLKVWVFFFHNYLHIPYASEALAMSVKRTPYPWYLCWVSQLLSFFEYLLQITVFGHRVIACVRLAGFHALRNTYRPLSATSIIEFFNRFYFYFKELLVDFFFYPTFFRYFRKHPRLRLTAATFAAAGFGNMFFHFMRDYWMIPRVGLPNALINFQVFAFYCVALATGLSLSQLRKRKAPHPGLLRGHVLPVMGVLFFYCVLDVFGSSERLYPLREHFRYLGHMFGLNY